MNTQSVEITSAAIKKVLQRYSSEQAIAEYVWNSFDAKATIVHIDFEIDSIEFDTYKLIRVSDNGEGINHDELGKNFRKFLESNKATLASYKTDLVQGKNGYGRFTFHKFARFAKWHTTFKSKENKSATFNIQISSDSLKDYSSTEPKNSNSKIGTYVEFSGITPEIGSNFIEQKLMPYLRAEFAWFLELKENSKIFIDGVELDCTSIIADRQSFTSEIAVSSDEKMIFKCKYLRWTNKLNDEYSKFYFLNEMDELKSIKTTLLNKKGDNFWHSVIVVSDFFDKALILNADDEEEKYINLFSDSDDKKTFRELVKKLNNFLKEQRRPFLKEQAEILISKYVDEEVFPKFSNNEWDKTRKENLEIFVKELYEVEPAVFMRLNKEQKKVFLELLNLIMDSSESENLFKIIESIVELDSEDRAAFAKILETTRLKQVIATINLITNRLETLENLKRIVFDHELKANERNHLQKYIEKHYWIFGEEYRLVCAEEVKFEEALRKYIYLLRGVSEKVFINHPEKYREMDLFLAGTDFRDGKPHNVVIEIKNPSTIKILTSTEVSQIKKYIDVILSVDKFNDANEFWSFYLIGQDYDNIVNDDLINKNTGLLRQKDNHCLYVKKWSELTNDIERRLKYLKEKLEVEREKISTPKTLAEIMTT